MGRSQKALKNVSTGLINKAAIMLLSFTTKYSGSVVKTKI